MPQGKDKFRGVVKTNKPVYMVGVVCPYRITPLGKREDSPISTSIGNNFS
ncbi:hypothetical protein OAN35_02915 [Flavobacteriaceae bacterium]|nr:hypothetical protein [Flavobacteriaceae bacterium]